MQPPPSKPETLDQPKCISFFNLLKLDAHQQRRRRDQYKAKKQKFGRRRDTIFGPLDQKTVA
jgi:hypothetical protein